eukprot:641517-Rhodomonas_salina.1
MGTPGDRKDDAGGKGSVWQEEWIVQEKGRGGRTRRGGRRGSLEQRGRKGWQGEGVLVETSGRVNPPMMGRQTTVFVGTRARYPAVHEGPVRGGERGGRVGLPVRGLEGDGIGKEHVRRGKE